MAIPYAAPLDKLLILGKPLEFREGSHYLDLGFAPEHIPELIRMATDPDLLWLHTDTPDAWAPVHAWRTLAQLRAEAAVEPLIALWNDIGEDDGYDDWVLFDLPDVLAMIGEVAISPLETYLLNPENEGDSRAEAGDALQEMAERDSNLRDRVVSILTAALEYYQDNSEYLNGSLAANLVDLRAVESAAVIKAAYYAQKVDLIIQGEWEEVAAELGLDPASVPGLDPVPEDMHAAWAKVFGPRRLEMLDDFMDSIEGNSFAALRRRNISTSASHSTRRKALPTSSFLSGPSSVTQQMSNRSRRQAEQRAKSKRKQAKKSRKHNRKRK